MTTEETFVVSLSRRQIGTARGTDIGAVGGEDVEVGVGVIVEADRAEITHGVRRRCPVSDVLALSADCKLLLI